MEQSRENICGNCNRSGSLEYDYKRDRTVTWCNSKREVRLSEATPCDKFKRRPVARILMPVNGTLSDPVPAKEK